MNATVAVASILVGIGIKFTQRELHFAEDRAGIVVAAGLGILFGQTKMAGRKHKLNLALHSYYREYANGNVDVVGAYTVDEIALEASADAFGDGVDTHTAMTEGSYALDKLAIKTDGRSDLDHDCGKGGLAIAAQIALVEAKAVVFGIGREYRNVLFAAVKNDLFIKCTQAFYFLYSAAAKTSLERYAEIIADRYLIKAFVEGHGLDVDVGIDDFDGFASYRACLVDDLLSTVAQMNAHVLQTILITCGIENLIYADTAKLLFSVSAKSAERTCSFVH